MHAQSLMQKYIDNLDLFVRLLPIRFVIFSEQAQGSIRSGFYKPSTSNSSLESVHKCGLGKYLIKKEEG